MKRSSFFVEKDLRLDSAAGRTFSFDLYCPGGTGPYPLLLFAHGFKGFKDWGHWPLIAEFFAKNGFAFLKFNFSHNGVTPEQPTEFADLEAFGQNNFTKELQDTDTLLNTLSQGPSWLPPSVDLARSGLIGHSRGGALAAIAACRDERIKALATWAAVSDLGFLWKNVSWIESWRNKGVIYIPNARTMQEMPLYYQIYEDYAQHGDAYLVEKQLPGFTRPMLIVHGSEDPGVPPSETDLLHSWKPDSELLIIEGAGHTFGGAHPWEQDDLPPHSRILADATLRFFEKHL